MYLCNIRVQEKKELKIFSFFITFSINEVFIVKDRKCTVAGTDRGKRI